MAPFSTRVPAHLTPNRLTQAVAALRGEGRAVIDLTLSNPTIAGFDYPPDLLEPLAGHRALTYDPHPFGLAEARRAVARDFQRQGQTVSPDRIIVTAGTSDAYSWLFKLLAGAGDDVLVPRPGYPLFDHLARLDLLIARPYDLEYHGVWSIDFASVARAVGPRTRALVVVSPNNPTGSVLSSSDLEQLAALCAARGIPIIADEVFIDFELEPHRRAARVLSRDDVLSFSLGGLSKTVGLPQVKLGWIAAAGPPPLVSSALERLELIADTYLSVSTPAQIAAPRLLEHGAMIRAQINARVSANYACLRRDAAASACTALGQDAGWYAVLQVPRIASEEEIVLSLLTGDGLLTHPGYFYDFPHEAFVVVSLLPEEAVFREGIGRLLRHFDCTKAAARSPSETTEQ